MWLKALHGVILRLRGLRKLLLISSVFCQSKLNLIVEKSISHFSKN